LGRVNCDDPALGATVFTQKVQRLSLALATRLRAGDYGCSALVVVRLVGINNLRTGFDGIERIGTVEAFGVNQGNSFEQLLVGV
jgi:hypothetical protein